MATAALLSILFAVLLAGCGQQRTPAGSAGFESDANESMASATDLIADIPMIQVRPL